MKNILLILVIILVLCVPVKAIIMPIGPGAIHKEEIPYSSDASFPEVKGMNLEGQSKSLPQDFIGKTNIVIIAFKREQQGDVDTWTTALKGTLTANPKLVLYELPVMKKFNFLMRFNVNNGMRYGISDKVARERTICLYLDKASFKAKLGLVSEDQIVVLLLNDQGNVVAKFFGPAIPAMVNHVTNLLK